MRAYAHQANERPRCRRRAASLKQFHSLRVGNAGEQLVWKNLAQSARGEVLCTEPGRPHPCPAGHAGPAHEGKSRTMSMHADEESDEGVVPIKRSNNEGLSSAETVEGRTSPKGNGGQTAAARTLCRDTASNGLTAGRQAARPSKTVRFTALLHHITTDLLKRSYLALARDAAPG